MSTATHIGSQIRDLRKAKKMTLTELAERSGFSTGHLSQAERGVSEVSISALKSIAAALEVQISWFFQGDSEQPDAELGLIVRGDQRRQLKFSGTGFSEELLSPDLKGETLLVMTELEPGADDPVEVTRPVEESGMVIEGELELWIDDRRFLLNSGDSFRIPRDRPHRVRNPGAMISRTLWVITPPHY